MKEFDVAIIGAGPAGATLARLLSEKYNVLLVDKRSLADFESFNDYEKCCGGLLAPDAQKVLAKLRLGVPKEVLTGPQPFTVKTIDFDNSLIRFYQRHYINIDRERFDSWLVSLIPRSVNREFGCHYYSYEEEGDSLKLRLRNQEGKFVVRTKVLIGADGAISRVRNQAFGDFPFPEKYGSIQEWYHTDSEVPYFMSIFDQSVTDFYSWAIQKENLLILGTAVPADQGVKEKFELLKSKMADKGYKLDKPFKRRGTLIFRPTKLNQLNFGNDKVALTGEAAGFISPSSAEGISYALRSAVNLAEALNTDFENFHKLYKKLSKPLKRNIFIKNLKSIVMYTPFLRKIVMKSRYLAMEVSE